MDFEIVQLFYLILLIAILQSNLINSSSLILNFFVSLYNPFLCYTRFEVLTAALF